MLTSSLSSCSDWLDITQEGTIEADRMFKDEVGFEEALAGVYQSMANSYTYGENLITVPDAQAQYWYLPSGTEPLAPIKEFDYSHSDAEDIIKYIWQYQYKSIANANLILQYIDEEGGVLSDDVFNIIKGEALGLRAYMHLDLLRQFGPQPDDLSQEAIPYRTQFTNTTVAPMKASEVLDYAEKDLLEAYQLLANDPIKTYGRKNSDLSNYDSGIAENFRGCRMNYYAVCGTLARLYAWKGDLQTAAKYAQEVINANATFWLINNKERSNTNTLYQSELVFSLYIGASSIQNGLTTVFGGGTTGTSNVLTLSSGMLGFMFSTDTGEGSSSDYRYDTYMWAGNNSVEGKSPRKYYWAETTVSATADIQPVVPMIRLTEMYYIVAEANASTPSNGMAREMLNEVRESRNLPDLYRDSYTEEDLKKVILAEARRDFVGEGQLFYLYKRWNADIETNKGNVSTTDIKWQLPRPQQEQEYNK